jgi:alkylation response protein AidB-like acyl-CoA dehydrogenase
MAIALIPLAHLSIGVMGIIVFASEEQKKRYLPKAALRGGRGVHP